MQTTTLQKPERISLSLQSCEGFIGLFLCEDSSLWMQEVLEQFVKKSDTELGTFTL